MITNGEHVRALGGLPATVTDTILDTFFNPASARLKYWVGLEVYADAGLQTPVDADRAQALKDAEAYLALYFVAPRLNMVITDSGIIRYKTVGSSSDQYSYLDPDELEELRQGWLQDALSICRPYIQLAGHVVGNVPAADDTTE